MVKGWKAALVAALLAVVTTAGQARAAGKESGGKGSADDLEKYMRHSGAEMQRMKMTGDIDTDFVTAMRQHHQAGIHMAEMDLKGGNDPKARELAQRIIDEQQRDLKEIDAWLAEHGSKGTGAGGK